MNAAETIAAMRAEVADIAADVERQQQEITHDPVVLAELSERIERMSAAITTAASWHGLA